jgi:hypothetical protein
LSHFHSQLQCLQHKTLRHEHTAYATGSTASSVPLFRHIASYSNHLHGTGVLKNQTLMWSQNSPTPTEPVVSLLHSQKCVTGTYSEKN